RGIPAIRSVGAEPGPMRVAHVERESSAARTMIRTGAQLGAERLVRGTPDPTDYHHAVRGYRGDVEIVRAQEGLHRVALVDLVRPVVPSRREAQIRLSTSERIARNRERRAPFPVGPDIVMATGIVVQMRIGPERGLTGDGVPIPNIAADRREEARRTE